MVRRVPEASVIERKRLHKELLLSQLFILCTNERGGVITRRERRTHIIGSLRE